MIKNKYLLYEIDQICKRIKFSSFKNKKILILGSNSFFGSYLALAFAYSNYKHNTNCKITCVSKNKPNERLNFLKKENKIYFITQDITKEKFINKISKTKFNYIFHSATYGQPAKWKSNELELLTLNTSVVDKILYNIRYTNTKFIYFSSCDVYGNTGKLIANENSNLNFDINSSRSNYALSKVLGERLCRYHKDKYGTNCIVLRPGHTFGVGQSIKKDKRVILELIKKAIFKKKIELIDDGSSIKTWGYITDVICMILQISQKGKKDIYNTTGNNFVSIKKIAEIISKTIANTSVKLRKIKKDDPDIVRVSSKRFIDEFGNYNRTKFSLGIKKLINSNINL